MPRKGSKVVKSPDSFRTHSGGLALHVQRQLLIDLECQGEAKPPADIVALRPELYGDSSNASLKQRRSVRDRIQYLRGLKRSDPPSYWYVLCICLLIDLLRTNLIFLLVVIGLCTQRPVILTTLIPSPGLQPLLPSKQRQKSSTQLFLPLFLPQKLSQSHLRWPKKQSR